MTARWWFQSNACLCLQLLFYTDCQLTSLHVRCRHEKSTSTTNQWQTKAQVHGINSERALSGLERLHVLLPLGNAFVTVRSRYSPQELRSTPRLCSPFSLHSKWRVSPASALMTVRAVLPHFHATSYSDAWPAG